MNMLEHLKSINLYIYKEHARSTGLLIWHDCLIETRVIGHVAANCLFETLRKRLE